MLPARSLGCSRWTDGLPRVSLPVPAYHTPGSAGCPRTSRATAFRISGQSAVGVVMLTRPRGRSKAGFPDHPPPSSSGPGLGFGDHAWPARRWRPVLTTGSDRRPPGALRTPALPEGAGFRSDQRQLRLRRVAGPGRRALIGPCGGQKRDAPYAGNAGPAMLLAGGVQ